jgi:hypothetical protein
MKRLPVKIYFFGIFFGLLSTYNAHAASKMICKLMPPSPGQKPPPYDEFVIVNGGTRDKIIVPFTGTFEGIVSVANSDDSGLSDIGGFNWPRQGKKEGWSIKKYPDRRFSVGSITYAVWKFQGYIRYTFKRVYMEYRVDGEYENKYDRTVQSNGIDAHQYNASETYTVKVNDDYYCDRWTECATDSSCVAS